jgi:hypothetical protein
MKKGIRNKLPTSQEWWTSVILMWRNLGHLQVRSGVVSHLLCIQKIQFRVYFVKKVGRGNLIIRTDAKVIRWLCSNSAHDNAIQPCLVTLPHLGHPPFKSLVRSQLVTVDWRYHVVLCGPQPRTSYTLSRWRIGQSTRDNSSPAWVPIEAWDIISSFYRDIQSIDNW